MNGPDPSSRLEVRLYSDGVSSQLGRSQRALISLGLATEASTSSEAPRSRRQRLTPWLMIVAGTGLLAASAWRLGWVDGASAVFIAVAAVLVNGLEPYVSRWVSRSRARRTQD